MERKRRREPGSHLARTSGRASPRFILEAIGGTRPTLLLQVARVSGLHLPGGAGHWPRREGKRRLCRRRRLSACVRQGLLLGREISPVHRQPHGIVHGGVYASMIESLASIGGALEAMKYGKTVVGLENHTSFVRAMRAGALRGTARPLTRGRRSQAWEVTLVDANGALIATGRVRLLVLEPDAAVAGAELGSKAG